MKIEVGKRYFRRDGSITPPLVASGELIRDPETGYVFCDYDGRVYLDACSSDLVSEVSLSYRTRSVEDTSSLRLPDEWSKPTKTETVNPAPAGTIDDTLNARGNNYGDFHDHASMSQELSGVMRATPKWSELSPAQREALEMIQHKIARILNGNPLYLDSWTDIVGYAELGKRETERLGGK